MLFCSKASVRLILFASLLTRQHSVVAFASQFSVYSLASTVPSITSLRTYIHMQQQPNNSGRRVMTSRDDAIQGQGKSERTNRLFSVLKGNSNPRPATASDAIPNTQASVPAATGDAGANANNAKPGGRKRNRGKSNRGVENEQGPTKTVSPPAQIVRDSVTKVHVSEPMDVVNSPAKPAFMTNHLFNSLSISENSKRALTERMNIR